MPSTSDLRQSYIDFFVNNGHRHVPSSSLIPAGDKTLMFTNAGMVQFKDTFLGQEQRSYSTAVSSQRCMRAGGKHNDLENVGYTNRHLTFFEMLGNFSFGDYFKEQAIVYAWDYLTKALAIAPEKLLLSVHHSDGESERIWQKVSSNQCEILQLGDVDNFWQMGNTGPCGPCSEIYFDRGDTYAGGKPGAVDEGERWVEIWNLVFMQYNKMDDGSMLDLPQQNVDTGLGLERLAAVMQGVESNFQIDLFSQLCNAIQTRLSTSVPADKKVHLNIVADHIRSCTFLIADGVLPSNEGAGYVLRRIMRRALRHFKEIGSKAGDFAAIVNDLSNIMSGSYPEITEKLEHTINTINDEEARFLETLDRGLNQFNKLIQQTKGDVFSGEFAFLLYDTYGFPLDMTVDLLRERNLKVDYQGYDDAMTEQQNRAKAATNFTANQFTSLDQIATTTFVGYEHNQSSSKVIGLWDANQQTVMQLNATSGFVALDNTCFYKESGGQTADTGVLSMGDTTVAKVTDCQAVGDVHMHAVEVMGTLQVNDQVQATIDVTARQATARHHSATHLLHAALLNHLGDGIEQRGSWVGPTGMRFDISFNGKIEPEKLTAIEREVNQVVMRNLPVTTQLLPIKQAIDQGAKAFFSEKYGETVRVLNMADGYSVELCGGTHVKATGDIGPIKLLSESSIASGVRRIEGIAGNLALQYFEDNNSVLDTLAKNLGSSKDAIATKVTDLQEKLKAAQQQLTTMQAESLANDMRKESLQIKGHKALALILNQNDAKLLATKVQEQRSDDNIVIGIASSDDKSSYIIACGEQTTVKANDLIQLFNQATQGRGGGKPDLARGGCNGNINVDELLQLIQAAS